MVGISCNDAGCRGFLWQKEKSYDLNDLVDLPEGETIVSATAINDFGWITGRLSTAAGTVPFILKPKR